MEKEFIARMIYVAEQGLKVRSATQVRGALDAIKSEVVSKSVGKTRKVKIR